MIQENSWISTSQSMFLKEQIKILGGVFEGRYLNAIAMTEIATIPSKEVLIAQFVNLINSPIQRFAVALGAVAEQKGAA